MAKGFFTQGISVLFEKAPTRVQLREALEPTFEIAREDDGGDGWAQGRDGLIVTYRPDVNGYVNVDVVNRKWPDHMGDPAGEPELFAAWTFGHFGPYAYPGNLERAGEHNLTWEDAGDAVENHEAFVRIRLSYVFGAGDDAPVMPGDCDPLHELNFVYSLAGQLMAMPGAVALFNPGGEVLTSGEMLARSLQWSADNELEPLDVWSNLRFFQLDDSWSLMDTVGNAQFNLPDLEAVFQPADHEPNDVAALLRNITGYLIENGPVIEDGHTVDGPGGDTWGVHAFSDSLSSPPRDVLCFVPAEGNEPPAIVFDRGNSGDDE
ncbi:MAG: DUF4261 domain-containing protein [Planctomycetes bacterium]|nr:DUF4261 domain-containing protein [Planctomycetota bacterium]